MAIRYVDSNFGSLVVPTAVARINVRNQVSGLGISGLLAIVGESDAGPATSDSTEDITQNYFSPTQLGAVISKYGSGQIVDAFRALASPSSDGDIQGSPTRIYIYKTNSSLSASGTIPGISSAYGSLFASSPGSFGNQMNYDTDIGTEAIQPSTGLFTFIPHGAGVTMNLRLNGGSALGVDAGSNTSPSEFVDDLDTLNNNVFAYGGENRNAFSGNAGVSLTLVASGNDLTLTLETSSTFTVTPSVGDTLVIPDGSNYGTTVASVFQGGSNVNRGSYVVTAVTNTSALARITATKLGNTSTSTVIVAPTNVSTTFSAGPDNDLQVYSPVSFAFKSGTNKGSFASAASTNVSATVSGDDLRINFLGSVSFAADAGMPLPGDDLLIPSGSALAGAGSANVGWYTVSTVVSATGSAYIVASRVSNGAPVNVSSGPLSGSPDTTDLQCRRKWISGVASGMSIFDGGAAIGIDRALYELGTDDSAEFISSASTPALQLGTEYQATLLIKRAADSLEETYEDIGGEVLLKVGYLGTTGSLAVGNSTLTFTVTGGSGSSFNVSTTQFSSIGDLVSYINTQTGFAAEASAAAAQLPVVYTEDGETKCIFDLGTYGICSSVAADEYPGQIKADLFDFKNTLAGSPSITFVSTATAGLPDPMPAARFLTGGSRGATSGAAVINAIDALEGIDCNFVVPLFSQDAAADAALGLTAVGSTYSIDAINAYIKTHCLAMSAPKRKRNRLGVVSKLANFAAAKLAAQNLASSRVALMFQQSKAVGGDGSIKTYQPWYSACIAAGMQAVGQYRSITRKFANISGITTVGGVSDFNPANLGQLEDALLAGLLVLEAPQTGGFRFVSDQTTYSKDDNFVFNSLQVMHTADLIALDLANSLDNFAVGKSISDITAAVIASFVSTKMNQYFSNRYTAPSVDAPAGYNSLAVNVNGPVASVSVNIYPANAIYFVPITIDVSQASQSA